jgi:hypothetical protein
MAARMLLFVHALLGTLLIVTAHHVERMAEESEKFKRVVPWLMYIVIFLILLVLELVFEKWSDYVQKRKERRLKDTGLIEGCWLERSGRLVGDKVEYDLGAFFTITYLPEIQFFRVGGEVFKANGEDFGYFVGYGRPDPTGAKLMYGYEGKHGDKPDHGTGSFAFRDQRQGHATRFHGSFHGVDTEMVRQVDGERTEKLDEYLSLSERNQLQRERVVAYLHGKNSVPGLKPA